MEPAPGGRAPRGGAASTAAEAGLSSSSAAAPAASSSQAEQGAQQGQRQPQQPGGGGGHEGAQEQPQPLSQQPPAGLSRYESQKRRDWNTFLQYLRNHKPPLTLPRCSGAHVIEFLKYLDQFGKTKVHADGCAYFGQPNPPAPCACPLRQAWGSLDALIGRLRAAFEEHGGRPDANPFGARAVRLYLREVRDSQSKARGIAYEKKRRKRPSPSQQAAAAAMPSPASAAPERPEVVHPVPEGHFLIPHPQFVHGHFMVPGDADAAAGSANGNGNGASNGDELAMAAAAAEAHAAGCMLPLSVFN